MLPFSLRLPGVLAIARFTFTEALRGRLLLAALLVAATGVAVSAFLGEMAITESARIQGSALAAFSRLAAVVLLLSFVVTGLAREQADKGLELLLSLPLPRSSYVLGKLAGYAVSGGLIALIFSLPLFLYAPPANVVAWGLALSLELLLVAAAALACTLVVGQSALSLLLVAAFYALSRIMTSLLAITSSPIAPADSAGFTVMRWTMQGLATLLPRMDQFGNADWLWHTVHLSTLLAQIGALSLHALIYAMFLACIALFDFYRKNW
jgi:ABC-type Na+ efflux pump permease subunit